MVSTFRTWDISSRTSIKKEKRRRKKHKSLQTLKCFYHYIFIVSIYKDESFHPCLQQQHCCSSKPPYMGPCHGGLEGLGQLRGPIGGIGPPCDPPEGHLHLYLYTLSAPVQTQQEARLPDNIAGSRRLQQWAGCRQCVDGPGCQKIIMIAWSIFQFIKVQIWRYMVREWRGINKFLLWYTEYTPRYLIILAWKSDHIH